MFLSNIGEIYYLFFLDESGSRHHKVSSKCRKKSRGFILHQFNDFKEFLRIEGNKLLHSIGICEFEYFLSKIKQEASNGRHGNSVMGLFYLITHDRCLLVLLIIDYVSN